LECEIIKKGKKSDLTLITAWIFVFVGTIFPQILSREFFAVDSSWLVFVQLSSIFALLALTVIDDRFRSLRAFSLVLLIIHLQFFVRWSTIGNFLGVTLEPGFWTFVANRTLAFLFSLLLLAVLLLTRYNRDELFLRWGSIKAKVEPEPLPTLDDGKTWRWVGIRWGAGIILITFLVLALQNGTLWILGLELHTVLIVIPVILLMAAFNAFNEEFVFRAAPLSELREGVGKRQALFLMGAVFGISHFYGTPSGIPAVLMGVFLGWFLGKSMFETRGIGFAFTLHFILDVIVFTFA